MKKLALLMALCLACLGCASKAGDYYVIDHFYVAEEGAEFEEAFGQLTVDTYDWYKSVEGRDGVFVFHAENYTADLLREWKKYGIFQVVPSEGFWYLVVSPNYLDSIGFPLTEDQRQMVADGVRLYLLPGSMPEDEAALMQDFLEEDALQGIDVPPMIDTVFQQRHEIAFDSYDFDGTFDLAGDQPIERPVIYVASTANMRYFESESLIATGAEDGYIKLTSEAYETYASNLPESMTDRGVTFSAM